MIKNLGTNKVHIVVLTWNNKDVLKRCLESIENINYSANMYDYTNFTINVIDNNSSEIFNIFAIFFLISGTNFCNFGFCIIMVQSMLDI